MECLGECLEMGPPPDSILFLPPPPAPLFLQHPASNIIFNSTLCSAETCETGSLFKRLPTVGDFVELQKKDTETWSMVRFDDTWFLILVASSLGILLLGASLAMFLLKCREMKIFESDDCTVRVNHQPMKNHETRECISITNMNNGKLAPPPGTLIYHPAPNVQDNRMVWAALTPRGTKHFISETYPRNLINYGENDDHYESVENFPVRPVLPTHPPSYQTYLKGLTLMKLARDKSSCYNSGFVDYEYEEPTPLIESYQMNDIDNRDVVQYATLDDRDMHGVNLEGSVSTLKHGIPMRPRVSSPTRIEHPNLPPLNLFPHKNGTLKRNNTLNKNIDPTGVCRYT